MKWSIPISGECRDQQRLLLLHRTYGTVDLLREGLRGRSAPARDDLSAEMKVLNERGGEPTGIAGSERIRAVSTHCGPDGLSTGSGSTTERVLFRHDPDRDARFNRPPR